MEILWIVLANTENIEWPRLKNTRTHGIPVAVDENIFKTYRICNMAIRK